MKFLAFVISCITDLDVRHGTDASGWCWTNDQTINGNNDGAI